MPHQKGWSPFHFWEDDGLNTIFLWGISLSISGALFLFLCIVCLLPTCESYLCIMSTLTKACKEEQVCFSSSFKVQSIMAGTKTAGDWGSWAHWVQYQESESGGDLLLLNFLLFLCRAGSQPGNGLPQDVGPLTSASTVNLSVPHRCSRGQSPRSWLSELTVNMKSLYFLLAYYSHFWLFVLIWYKRDISLYIFSIPYVTCKSIFI